PDLSFLPDNIATERGFITVDERYRTTDPQVFAVGDAVRLGLLTDAIGAGRVVARTIDDLVRGRYEPEDRLPPLPMARVHLEYYDPGVDPGADLQGEASQCASCGACRDCGLCVSLCPRGAISRRDGDDGSYEYVVDGERCIGCGFCADACPCGVWQLHERPEEGP
ncbi:MAG: 4Fe-4S dicluster domain-containing protein, partial [Syntrophales bacterium]|nr:4Fe-4S dicluster domain-containing protein [Syntrophales bacterium]